MPFFNIKDTKKRHRLTLWKEAMRLYQALRNVGHFRSAFDFGGRDVAHWFPGHMAKGDRFVQTYLYKLKWKVRWFYTNTFCGVLGLKQMRANLKNVDCIIGVEWQLIGTALLRRVRDSPQADGEASWCSFKTSWLDKVKEVYEVTHPCLVRRWDSGGSHPHLRTHS